MARRCPVTGKGVQTGNNVSHAHNKTRRRFLPNLQRLSVYSDGLARMVRLRVATSALRTIEHAGGFDAFLLASRDADLTPKLRRLKHLIQKAPTKTVAETN